jgi:hypothetical protein
MTFCSEIRQNLLQTIGRNHSPIHYREIIPQFIAEKSYPNSLQKFQWNTKVTRSYFSTQTLSGRYVRETKTCYLPTMSVEKITVSIVDEQYMTLEQ